MAAPTEDEPPPPSAAPPVAPVVSLPAARPPTPRSFPLSLTSFVGRERELTAILLERKIPHEFRELPGKHDWAYWDSEVQEVLRIAHRRMSVLEAPVQPLPPARKIQTISYH